MEAHNGLSARIVEETGFRGIWASGLSISAALGVRDNNEASWTQVLEVVEFMADATSVPILLDGDTGYGNFNNMRRLVHKLEQRGVAAVCIEDKLFPKTNSFIQSEQQPLADADEFAGKIAAVKDAQGDPDFCIVARLEAFIAGWGLKEMLRRAGMYAAAGADALLVHSKRATPEQILAFAAEWQGNPCPLVIVPTTFYSTPVEVFARAGVRLAIWANHNVRSAITAMQRTSRKIFEDRSVLDIEDGIAPVREVFRLQNADELLAAEERYLPKHPQTRALVLAASRGSELGEVTAARPKTMVPVGGVPLLHKLVAQLHAAAVKDVVVVRGFGKEQVHAPDVRFIDNDEYAHTGELVTLDKAAAELTGELVISYGDILFRKYILSNLLDEPGDIVLAVDAAWQQRPTPPGGHVDYVACSRAYSLQYGERETRLTAMAPDLPREQVCGEWIGLVKTTAHGSETLRGALAALAGEPGFAQMRLDDLFRRLLADGAPVSVLYITGHWLDVDNLDDLAQAQAF